MVLITEIFESIQGEGAGIGKPCIFVRVWGCNLRCRFDGVECDTPYAVYTEKNKALDSSALDVIDRIQELTPKHIVWTGGEPTLYQDFIVDVMTGLIGEYTCEVETNGTKVLSEDLINVVDWFNLSLKLKSSNQLNEHYDNVRVNDKAIGSFPLGKTYFKFVINSKEDFFEVEELTKKYPFPTYLMPQGVTRDEVIKNSEAVVDMCIKYDYRFSPREHIIIWDKKRGV